jgi:[ribosomal protein S5]-alanine N-acetyltransferase
MIARGLSSLPYFDAGVVGATVAEISAAAGGRSEERVPTLTGSLITLRDLQTSDAPALLESLTTEAVARFISAPPATVEAFEKFIAWTHRQRDAGEHVCFAVVPRGGRAPIGVFQVRSLGDAFDSAEWGFAIASEYWGTGVFADGANMVIAHAFQELGVRRLEARAAVDNGRGNGALEKVGAVREAVMRRSFPRRGEHHDQALWTILAEDWTPRAIPMASAIH